jgi:hypothetical protein
MNQRIKKTTFETYMHALGDNNSDNSGKYVNCVAVHTSFFPEQGKCLC